MRPQHVLGAQQSIDVFADLAGRLLGARRVRRQRRREPADGEGDAADRRPDRRQRTAAES
jgi:hypothetical protein